jgi:hypothetical protein
VAVERAIAQSPALLVAAGAAVASLGVMPALPLLKPLFRVPGNGVGLITVTAYPKGWDYAVLVILFLVSAAGGLVTALVAGRIILHRQSRAVQPAALDAASEPSAVGIDRSPSSSSSLSISKPALAAEAFGALPPTGKAAAWPPHSEVPLIARPHGRAITLAIAAAVALAMFPAHDFPYELVDAYHEGESLSPASVLMAGGRPYRDVFFMHGLATDGGLDLLVMGSPPNPIRARRLKAVLTAITLAVLVPIAAEVSTTIPGVLFGVVASLAALAAGELPAFGYFRLLPLLLMVWLTLSFLRRGRPLLLVAAATVASAGLLWSVDVGLFAVAGFFAWLIARTLLPGAVRPSVSVKMGVTLGAIAALVPLVILAGLRGDISRFFRDTFLRLPECFDAIYSIPAPPLTSAALLLKPFEAAAWLDTPSARYYVPIIAWGLLVALAYRAAARGEGRVGQAMLLIALTGFFELRTAAGRSGWAHTRMAVPLLGITLVSFALEPLARSLRRRRSLWTWLGALCGIAVAAGAFHYLELPANAAYLTKYYRSYRERLRPDPSYVRFPNPRAKDLYTYKQEADDLGALNRFSDSQMQGPIFDFSGEKDLYYMLNRPASTRCHDIPYLADPVLGKEALHQLERRPPVFVVVRGIEVLHNVDGVTYEQRTPWLARWIDEHYPQRVKVGRFVVGLPKEP